MRNPSELYELRSDADLTSDAPAALLVTLGGFVDAGQTQQLLTKHLLDNSEHDVIGSFDADQLYDYRGRRPAMVFDTNRYTSYDVPKIELYRLTDRSDQVYYLLSGVEPDYQWERMVAAIGEIVQRLGVELVVTTHGIPMGVPHTRPIGMTAHATDPALIDHAASPFGMVQVPGSLSALLEMRLGQAGIDVVGYSVHIPAYLAQSAFPDGALVALGAISEGTGLDLPNDALVTAAEQNRVALARETAGNGEVQQMVAGMEQQYDAFLEQADHRRVLGTGAAPADLPSADELGAELEEFLRSVGDDPEQR